MAEQAQPDETQTDRSHTEDELTGPEKKANVIRLAFDGSEEKYNEFVRIVRSANVVTADEDDEIPDDVDDQVPGL